MVAVLIIIVVAIIIIAFIAGSARNKRLLQEGQIIKRNTSFREYEE